MPQPRNFLAILVWFRLIWYCIWFAAAAVVVVVVRQYWFAVSTFDPFGWHLVTCDWLQIVVAVFMSSPAMQFVCPWPCLVAFTPKSVSTRSFAQATVASQSKFSKMLAQALFNSCNIPASQLPKPILKGEQISIKISEDHYSAGVSFNINIRFKCNLSLETNAPLRIRNLF